MSASKVVPFIAVEDADAALAGATVWWHLEGDVARAALAGARARLVGDRALPATAPAPPCPTPSEVLRRALRAHETRDVQVLPLEDAGWHALARVPAKGRELQPPEVIATAGIEETSPGATLLHVLKGPHADTAPIEESIRNAYNQRVDLLTSQDISGWLVRVVRDCLGAAPMSGSGKFYFVPRTQLAAWRAVVARVRGVSGHSFYELPTMRTEEAVAAVLAIVRAEAQRRAGSLLEAVCDPEIGKRALETKRKQVEELHAWVGGYVGLLGEALPDLQGRIEELRAAVAAAALNQGRTEG